MNIIVKVLDRKAPAPSFLRNVEFDSMEKAEAFAEEYRNSQYWSIIHVQYWACLLDKTQFRAGPVVSTLQKIILKFVLQVLDFFSYIK